MTPHVRKLVREDRLDLGCVELRHRRDRQHDNRPKASDDERDINAGKLDDTNDSRESKPAGNPIAACCQLERIDDSAS